MIGKPALRSATALCLLILVCFGGSERLVAQTTTGFSKSCVACHQKANPGLVDQWRKSRHFQEEVGCYECHRAERSDVDAMEHEKTIISVVVSPKDCARCHQEVVEHFAASRHAGTVDRTLNSQCSILVKTVISASIPDKSDPFGNALAGTVTGCSQCHGSAVKLKKSGNGPIQFDPATWPNEGMGRINPDGSHGACIACHQRHEFSPAEARQPESCGKCHSMGSGNPMLDIYRGSGHGRSYYTNKAKMSLDSGEWVLGKDYSVAPTCASCHMGAVLFTQQPVTTNKPQVMPSTHNTSLRFNWDNSPVKAPTNCECSGGFPPGTNPPGACSDARPVDNQQIMQNVCLSCHGYSFLAGYQSQRKAQNNMVNEKYITPGAALYKQAKIVLSNMEKKLDTYTYFTHPIDYIWLELAGHKAAQARIAVDKGNPDYAYTGNFSLAEYWFKDFVPQLRWIIKKGKNSSNSKARESANLLETKLNETLENPFYGSGWAGKYKRDCKNKNSGD